MKQTIIGMIIALVAVVFALQNSHPVQVEFLTWTLNCSMALLLLIVLAIGITTGLLVMTPAILRKNSAISSGRKKISELEKQLTDTTNKNYR